jgi:Ion channel
MLVVTARERLKRLEAGHSYHWVLAMVLAVVFAMIALPEGELGRFLLVLLEAATLLVAVWTAHARSRVTHVVVIVAATSVVVAGLAAVTPGDAAVALRVITLLLVAGLPLILTRGVVTTIRQNGVTLNAVNGVLTLYLLLGLVFGTVYDLVNAIGSAPFFAGQPAGVHAGDFIYFAFTTQTTVGFGDFVPGTDVGRALAAGQAVIGQLYLVTVVSLVISNLGRAPRQRDAGGPEGQKQA